jgi:hypothetical protein
VSMRRLRRPVIRLRRHRPIARSAARTGDGRRAVEPAVACTPSRMSRPSTDGSRAGAESSTSAESSTTPTACAKPGVIRTLYAAPVQVFPPRDLGGQGR